ncbi:8-oxo-dGTP pyrophosphatase MutT (NUDIX family) [Xanthobacter sp. SG618]|uniref:NUDIX hydrolase n=1 Tax=Xanthobacter sp. SG618 TaxID=2587121 RepID=UPI001819FAA6|nr:8-oxo-dGTP pyrophosphatase MutT (NUDIX family) [Xanthobacter sp. SG618]
MTTGDAIDRPAARLLVLDAQDRLLLFRFAYAEGALAGNVFWAPPGGGLEPGETYEAAACRELLEETGLRIAHPGPAVARREVSFMMPDGQRVRSREVYFLVRAPGLVVSSTGWSEDERKALVHHAWWKRDALASLAEQVWPEDVAAMLAEAGIWR